MAGGLDSSSHYLSSTKVLTTTSPAWSLTTPLPRTLHYLRCVTTGGNLYATGEVFRKTLLLVKVSSGGKDGVEDDHDHGLGKSRGEVLAWLDEEQE